MDYISQCELKLSKEISLGKVKW